MRELGVAACPPAPFAFEPKAGLVTRLLRSRIAGRPLEPRVDLDVGRELPFIVNHLLGADFAIRVGVEHGKKALRIGLHFIKGEQAVMVAVGLVEPAGERIVVRGARAERFAHRADEWRPRVDNDIDRPLRWSCGGEDHQNGADHDKPVLSLRVNRG